MAKTKDIAPNAIVLAPKQLTGNGKKQVIPAQVHAAAAALVQRLVDDQVDISALLLVAKDFARLQAKLLEMQPCSAEDLALAEIVPDAVRPNGIASAQSVRCKAFAAGNYTAWLQAAYEEIILRHGYKPAKSSGTTLGLDPAVVDAMDLEQVKKLLNSRSSTKCITGKWQDGPEKAEKLAAVEADIELLTARRKELEPSYGSKQPKAKKQLTAVELLAAAGIDPESKQGKALTAAMAATV